MMSAKKGEVVTKYPKYADKQYMHFVDRGRGRRSKNSKILWQSQPNLN